MSIRFIPTFRQTTTTYTNFFENFTQSHAKNNAHSAGAPPYSAQGSYQKPSQFNTYSHPSAYSFTRGAFPSFNRPSFINNMQGDHSSNFQYANNIDVSHLFTHMMKQMIDQLSQSIHTFYAFNFAQDYSHSLLAALTQLYNKVHNANFFPTPPFSTTGPSAYTNTRASTAGSWGYTNNFRPPPPPFGNNTRPSGPSPSADEGNHKIPDETLLLAAEKSQIGRRNLCAYLNLPMNTPDGELRSAYKKAALKTHPIKEGIQLPLLR